MRIKRPWSKIRTWHTRLTAKSKSTPFKGAGFASAAGVEEAKRNALRRFYGSGIFISSLSVVISEVKIASAYLAPAQPA